MKYNHQKLIISVMPKSVGRKVLLGLREYLGVNMENINGARAAGMYNPMARRGIDEQAEKEMLSVVVPEEKADEIFAYIYALAEIGEPHHGIIF